MEGCSIAVELLALLYRLLNRNYYTVFINGNKTLKGIEWSDERMEELIRNVWLWYITIQLHPQFNVTIATVLRIDLVPFPDVSLNGDHCPWFFFFCKGYAIVLHEVSYLLLHLFRLLEGVGISICVHCRYLNPPPSSLLFAIRWKFTLLDVILGIFFVTKTLSVYVRISDLIFLIYDEWLKYRLREIRYSRSSSLILPAKTMRRYCGGSLTRPNFFSVETNKSSTFVS